MASRKRKRTSQSRSGTSAYAQRLGSVSRRVGKALGRGPVSPATARKVESFRRGLRRSKLYDTYARGFAINEAIRTGKLPTLKAVKRDPRFKAALDVIAATRKGTAKGPGSPLAKALVQLGVRDERAKYNVGNSPDAGRRRRR